MNIYPKMYLENVTKISEEIIKKNDIKGIILDVDNTLVDFDKKLLDGAEEWVKQMKKNNIKLYILSNTNKVDKVKKVASILEIPYIYFAKKPFKKGFIKIKKEMNLNSSNIAVVGDQIMTDVIGGNRCNMFTILTKPIDKRDIFVTKIKRGLENVIIKKYLRKQKDN